MRIRILLAGLLTGALLVTAPMAQAASRACRAAAADETGASDLLNGEAAYAGTVTVTDPGTPLNLATKPTERSSGTVSARIFLAAKPCANIEYTLVALYDEPASDVPGVGTDPAPVELSRTTTYAKAADDPTEIRITLDVPEHPSTCVHLYMTTSAGDAVLDRAPDEGRQPPLNQACIEDGGSPGGQYWN